MEGGEPEEEDEESNRIRENQDLGEAGEYPEAEGVPKATASPRDSTEPSAPGEPSNTPPAPPANSGSGHDDDMDTPTAASPSNSRNQHEAHGEEETFSHTGLLDDEEESQAPASPPPHAYSTPTVVEHSPEQEEAAPPPYVPQNPPPNAHQHLLDDIMSVDSDEDVLTFNQMEENYYRAAIDRPHVPILWMILCQFYGPAAHWTGPIGYLPSFLYDNVIDPQVSDWPKRLGAILVWFAGTGVPTEQEAGEAKGKIVSFVGKTVCNISNAKLATPQPRVPAKRGQPPNIYLLWNLTPLQIVQCLQIRCVSTVEETLFFAPNRLIVDTFVCSLQGFDEDDPVLIRRHLNARFDEANLNDSIKKAINRADIPEYENLTDNEITDDVRESLRVSVTHGKTKKNSNAAIVHVFLNTPTQDADGWLDFKGDVVKCDLKDAVMGMNIRVFTEWRCKICNSQAHDIEQCFLFKEEGWKFNPKLRDLLPKKSEDQPQTRSQNQVVDPMAFSSIQQQPQAGRGRGGRGRGAGRARGRGEGRGRGNFSRGRGFRG